MGGGNVKSAATIGKLVAERLRDVGPDRPPVQTGDSMPTDLEKKFRESGTRAVNPDDYAETYTEEHPTSSRDAESNDDDDGGDA